MAKITKVDPEDFSSVNIVQLDIEAKNNIDALLALENWAADHGFARLHQDQLRIVVGADGKPVFRGACYRMTEEERNGITFEIKSITARARRWGQADVA